MFIVILFMQKNKSFPQKNFFICVHYILKKCMYIKKKFPRQKKKFFLITKL